MFGVFFSPSSRALIASGKRKESKTKEKKILFAESHSGALVTAHCQTPPVCSFKVDADIAYKSNSVCDPPKMIRFELPPIALAIL